MAKFLDQAGLQIVWDSIKTKFESKEDLVELLKSYVTETELVEELANYVLNSDFESFKTFMDAKKVDKDIESAAGKARIFNEADGGGAKFENVDGTASFAGVNSDTNGGIGAQLYDIDVESNKGAKLDVTKNGIFYTTGDESAKPAASRDVSDNELITRKDLSEVEIPEYTLVKDAQPGDYAAIYHLTKDGVNVGEAINIAKDQLLKSVEVKTCTEKDQPITGLEVGDKYLDFLFIVEAGAEAHTYIAIKDMVKPYTAGEGIVITSENAITFDPDVLSTVNYVDQSITNLEAYFTQELNNEHAGRVAGDNLKVDKKITGSQGEAYIFNEADGGGAKFVNNDGLESFVGVNDGGEDGLAAQIYADKLVEGKWTGAKIDVTNTGIYYTVGDKTFAERAVAGNEIATMADVEAAEPDALTEAEIRDICK